MDKTNEEMALVLDEVLDALNKRILVYNSDPYAVVKNGSFNTSPKDRQKIVAKLKAKISSLLEKRRANQSCGGTTMKSCWVELLCVDVFVRDRIGDTIKVKLPIDKCKDVKPLAAYLAPWAKAAVAFRRFKYTEDGPEYLDEGWVYFRGVHIDREEILSGRVKETYPDFPLGDILEQNVKYNNFDIIWFKDYNWAYPFREDDNFVEGKA